MSLFTALREKGLWRGYHNHIVRLNPILERMSERGMPVDHEAFESVVAQLNKAYADAKAVMQTLVPFEVKQKKVYKKTPKKKIEECVQIDGVWVRPLAWTPSNKGLVTYMKFKGHPIPKHIKTRKDTTDKLEIARLFRSTKDPLYAAVIQYRKVQTVITNHVKNWKPGPDARVHTTFYFDPATGQLSSRRPNVQNAPKHDDPEFGGYAKVFRSMIKAKPGHSIMEFDFKSFHVQTLGFNAQDADMMRIGRLDIHSFFTATLLKLSTPEKMLAITDDKELLDFLVWVKKNHKLYRDTKAKRAILGYNNGLGYHKLYLQNKEDFTNEREAKRVMQELDGLFPKTKAYRTNICQKAHDQGYLISRHGYIRYFWEVFQWKGGEWRHGDDHEKALCFFTQNDAHGEIKDRIVTIGTTGLDEKFGMLNTIHDSIIFETPNELVIECRDTIKPLMEAPSIVLVDPVVAPKGLVVEVDVQAGPDWAHLKEI